MTMPVNNDRNIFDFLITDENEIVLIMHSQKTAPDEPAVVLVPEEHVIELFRNGDEQMTLTSVGDNVFNILQNRKELMVCEIEPTENPEETEIVYSYNAEIVNNSDEESDS